ncbi:uncharacterized protein LOC144444660 [Glandiceps talaboti]
MSFIRRLFGFGNTNKNHEEITQPHKEESNSTTECDLHGNQPSGERVEAVVERSDREDRPIPPSHDVESTENSSPRRVGNVVRSAFMKSKLPKETIIPYEFHDSSENSKMSPDLKIFVEDFVFVVHQDLLVRKSGYFKALLASGMIDSELMQTTREVRFYDVPPTAQAMQIILNFLYDKDVDMPSSKEEQVDILAAADFLEILLSPKLFRGIVTLENWSDYIEMAKTYNWEQLEDLINLILAAHYRFLKDGTELSSLSREAIAKIEDKTKCTEIRQFSKETLCLVLQHESNRDDNSGKILCCYDDRLNDWLFLDVFPPRCSEFHSALHSSYTHNYVGLKIGHWTRRFYEYDPHEWREMQIVTYNPLGDMKLVLESFIYDSFTGNWSDVSYMTPPGLSKADFLLAQSEDVLYAIPPYLTKKRGLIVYVYQSNPFTPLRWQRHVILCPHFQEDDRSTDVLFLNACLHQDSIYALCSDRQTETHCDSLFIVKVTPKPDCPDSSDFFDADFAGVTMDTAVSGNYARIFCSGDAVVLLASTSDRPSVIPPSSLIVFTLQKDTIATFKTVTRISAAKLGIPSLRDFLQNCKVAIVGCHLYILSADMKEDMVSIDIKTGVSCHVSLPHFIFEPWKDVLALFPLDVPQELGMCATMLKKKNIDIIRDDI